MVWGWFSIVGQSLKSCSELVMTMVISFQCTLANTVQIGKPGYILACTKKYKKWNFALLFWGHLKGGMETPQNDFQIYRPINDTWQAISIFNGNFNFNFNFIALGLARYCGGAPPSVKLALI